MLKIGLTGGIASGKSLASRYFSDLGIEVIDADLIARDLFKANSPHLVPLEEHFGDSIFSSNGELKRKTLGQRIFSDPNELKWLNNLTHPLINAEMRDQLDHVTSAYAILDIPLLIAKNGSIAVHLAEILDRVLVIATRLPTQIKRLRQRDNISAQEARLIIDTQSNWQQKRRLADDVIENNASKEQLKEHVDKMHDYYSSLALST